MGLRMATDALKNASPDRSLVSPTGKEIHVRPVRPNAGVQAQYRKQLDQMIDAMQKSLVWWLSAQYRANSPTLAEDAGKERSVGSPAMTLRRAMHRLTTYWQRRFDERSRQMALNFSDKAMGNADFQLRESLKASGFSVEFKMTAAANDVYQATIGENVGLIRSIAAEHLQEVEGLVMRSVTQGRKLDDLSKDLEKRYQVTKRRAALIARDQNNKATATITRVRQQGLGIKQARWMHSAGGKEPRQSHVAASGKLYDVDKGMYIDGEWIRPGEMINCRCVAQSVIPGFED
jgi:SPP1 gp7 family putative phage head morphogenesis protein